MVRQDDSSLRLTLPRDHRLRRSSEFEAVYQGNVRHNVGPLLISALPNGLDYDRLGMAISVRVGNAVTRNRIRRRLREAFRLAQYDLPTGYDFVITVRPHEALNTVEYQRLLMDAASALHTKWIRKKQKLDHPHSHDS